MPTHFQLIVLGSGPSGNSVATKCSQSGLQVAVVDPRPVGGTCALRGCSPKKVLVRAAEAVDFARRLDGKGVAGKQVTIDWPQLITFKREFTDPVTPGRLETYREKGIELLSGTPEFTGEQSLVVRNDDQQAEYTFDRLLVATGAIPRPLDFPGNDLVTHSDDFLELDDLPPRIVFIGGGYISFEFAHVVARSSAKATILEQGKRPLEAFDGQLVDQLVDRSGQAGIDIHTSSKVVEVRRTDDSALQVTFEQSEETRQLACDLVVHGAGRVPNTEGLQLEQANVRYGDRGIAVNSYLQSVSNSRVYATGDVADTGQPALTPVANVDATTVIHNLLQDEPRAADYGPVAQAVYTVPNLASVGMTEDAAREDGLEFDLKSGDWSDFSSVKKVGETHAFYKILISKNGRILGAHLFGPEAAEMINIFALAMRFRLSPDDLRSVAFTFPSFMNNVRDMVG